MTREEFKNNHWRYYLLLEKEFINTLDYVELASNNYSTFSIVNVKLLLQIGAEVDNIFKVSCNLTGRKNITDYIDPITEKYTIITDQKVSALNYSITLQPFKNWNKDKPSESLTFWKHYNNVKHDRIINFSNASLESTINALAALFILEMYLINDIYNENNDLYTNLPENESNLFMLNNWKIYIRSSKLTSNYEVYDGEDGTRIL